MAGLVRNATACLETTGGAHLWLQGATAVSASLGTGDPEKGLTRVFRLMDAVRPEDFARAPCVASVLGDLKRFVSDKTTRSGMPIDAARDIFSVQTQLFTIAKLNADWQRQIRDCQADALSPELQEAIEEARSLAGAMERFQSDAVELNTFKFACEERPMPRTPVERKLFYREVREQIGRWKGPIGRIVEGDISKVKKKLDFLRPDADAEGLPLQARTVVETYFHIRELAIGLGDDLRALEQKWSMRADSLTLAPLESARRILRDEAAVLKREADRCVKTGESPLSSQAALALQREVDGAGDPEQTLSALFLLKGLPEALPCEKGVREGISRYAEKAALIVDGSAFGISRDVRRLGEKVWSLYQTSAAWEGAFQRCRRERAWKTVPKALQDVMVQIARDARHLAEYEEIGRTYREWSESYLKKPDPKTEGERRELFRDAHARAEGLHADSQEMFEVHLERSRAQLRREVPDAFNPDGTVRDLTRFSPLCVRDAVQKFFEIREELLSLVFACEGVRSKWAARSEGKALDGRFTVEVV